MTDIIKKHIFFLDDEKKVREAVSETLEESGFEVSHFGQASECLERLQNKKCDLLITDLKMPEMDGIELLAKAKRLAPWVPVLVITGYGDIPTAVKAIKAGAVDFIEKPLDTITFLNKVSSILQQVSSTNAYAGKPLTESEKRILNMVIDGKSNKEIAFLLHRSVRTIEVHRARLMQKLSVDNLVDLVKRAAAMGLIELPAKEKDNHSKEDNVEKH